MGSLDTLVSGLFDYAGMFPPAELPYDQVLARAASFERTLERPHLVAASAVLPFERLAQTTADRLLASGFAPSRSLSIAVLGAPLGQGDEAARQAQQLAERNLRTAGERPAQRCVSFETKIAPDLDPAVASPIVSPLVDVLGPAGIRLYVEPCWTQWDRLEELAAILAEAGGEDRVVGLKVRGSGPTAIARSDLARVLVAVVDGRLPFKATAGLHHPVVEERHGNTLGFLNLAAALRLRQILGPEEMPLWRLEECLSTSDPGAFDFKEGLRWTDRIASCQAVEGAVSALAFSIGSCSLDEPDCDLVRLFAR